MKNYFLYAARLALVLTASLSAHAQLLPGQQAQSGTAFDMAKLTDPSEVLAKYEEFRAKKEYTKQVDALKRLLELRPFAGGLRYELARSYALADNKTFAYDTLIQLQQAGHNFDPTGDADFKNIEGTGAYDYIVKNLKENGKPFGAGRAAFTVQADQPMLESLAYDANGKRFLLGSVRTGEIIAVDATGKATTFIRPDATNRLYGVFALAVDAKNNRLYAASTSITSFAKFEQSSFGDGGLYQFELSTGKYLNRFAPPADGGLHLFTALTVASTGEVYGIDPPSRSVYQLRGTELRRTFQSADLVSMRSLAVSDNHKFLYISDFELGIYAADLERNQIYALTSKGQNLGGVDSLHYWNGNLIGVQSGFNPTRVMRFELTPDLRNVKQVRPIEAGKPALTHPSVGALNGKEIYFIANSQREFYDGKGNLLAGNQVQRRVIYKAPVDFKLGEELKFPDWAKEQLKKQQK
jgi:sugar lactone lactonase YvrE